MATFQRLGTVSVIAGSAVSLYRFVALAADGKFDHVGSAQGRADGVAAQAAAADGDAFAMQPLDGSIMKVEAGAPVTRGAQIASDNVGRVIDHVTTAGNHILGVALDAAGAAGEIIRVQVYRGQDGA
jgi:hypothetical protein